MDFRHVSARPVHPMAKTQAQRNSAGTLRGRSWRPILFSGIYQMDILVNSQDESRIEQRATPSKGQAGKEPARVSFMQDHPSGYVPLLLLPPCSSELVQSRLCSCSRSTATSPTGYSNAPAHAGIRRRAVEQVHL